MQRQKRQEGTTKITTAPALSVEIILARPRDLKRKPAKGLPKPAPDIGCGRLPRVARLMALAIKFQAMVEGGDVSDYADLARLGYVSRARITQIMNLLNLAPQIQEQILFLPPAFGRGLVTERHLRRLNPVIDWSEQRRLWSQLNASVLASSPPRPTEGSKSI